MNTVITKYYNQDGSLLATCNFSGRTGTFKSVSITANAMFGELKLVLPKFPDQKEQERNERRRSNPETKVGYTPCWKRGRIKKEGLTEEKYGNCRAPINHEGDCAFW